MLSQHCSLLASLLGDGETARAFSPGNVWWAQGARTRELGAEGDVTGAEWGISGVCLGKAEQEKITAC